MFEHCLYFNTAALARKLDREWAQAFKPFELTVPQAFMLRAILAQPGVLSSELAKAMVLSRPTVSRALDGLQGKLLIQRCGLAQDGRELQIYPSDSALAIRDALDAAAAAVTERLKNQLGLTAFNTVVADIKGVRAALQ